MVRVDVTPNAPPRLEAHARPVIDALRRVPGYRELALRKISFNGYPALWWEFLVPESGVLLHKVDVFFLDESGDGVALLTQAPAADWGSWTTLFATVRSSLVVRSPGD